MLHVDGLTQSFLCTMLDFPINELKPWIKMSAAGVSQ